MAQINLSIDNDLKRRFHIKCLENDKNMKDVLLSLVESYTSGSL